MKTILFTSLAAFGLLVSATASNTSADAKTPPSKTCIVSGNTLGSMGPAITKTHEGKKVKFCCKPCVAKFQKNPGKYLEGRQ